MPIRAQLHRVWRRRALVMLVAAATASGLAAPAIAATPAHHHPDGSADTSGVIPEPVSEQTGHGRYTLTPHTRIVAGPGAAEVAKQLAADLRPATGYSLPVVAAYGRHDSRGSGHDISLQVDPSAAVPGDQSGEGYRLQVSPRGVTVRAATAHGLFNAVQTIRQLLPAAIASPTRRHGPWTMQSTSIVDYPRYQYRGFMLDIARHYESPAATERLIDEASQYKINVFHLHLSDDQGFRLAINGFPRLTSIGGQGSVGTDGRTMDPGGFWTQDQYRQVVAYAAKRFMTVVPEVDTPGHNNAIIMSEYGDTGNPLLTDPHSINCSVKNPPQWNYTGDVGISALCPESQDTWTILTAIIDQLTALSPGPYYDLGGDEVPTSVLSQERYAALVNKEAAIVAAHNKIPMGWADISSAGTNPPRGSVAEYWNPAQGSEAGTETATDAVKKGMKLVMAPANHAYLDQRYAPDTPPNLGQTWACEKGCDVDQFYNWDPATYVTGVTEKDVIGVEGALWTETIRNRSEAEYMVFPRLLALAELGWSPRTERTADSPAYRDFLRRLGAEGPRFEAAGINFYPSPEVPWK